MALSNATSVCSVDDKIRRYTRTQIVIHTIMGVRHSCACDHSMLFVCVTDVQICLEKTHTFGLDVINGQIMKHIRPPRNDKEMATVAAYVLHLMGNKGFARLIASTMMGQVHITVSPFIASTAMGT